MSTFHNAYIDSTQEEARREGYDEAQTEMANVMLQLKAWHEAYHGRYPGEQFHIECKRLDRVIGKMEAGE